ncbi:MAG: hypothetical protein ACI4S3_07265 [Candidatus Gastranaerophilaceae bacterium]
MALYIDEDGTITLVQGDSGEIIVSGLDNKKNYDVYFAIQTLKRKPVVSELHVKSNFADTVTFVLTASYTDLLTVPKNKDYEVYQYGIKLCTTDIEDTVVIANNDYGSVNQLIVYPKIVEGV